MKIFILSILNILTFSISGYVNCDNCLQRQEGGENIDCSIQCIDVISNPNSEDECPVEQPSCNHYNYICPKITEITTCSEGGIDGYTTFQLSVIVKPNVDVKNIYAIYGDTYTLMHIPRAYQSSINYGSNIGGVNPFFINSFADTVYDSWLTVGISDGNLNNKLSSIGIDFNEWSEINDLDTTNGAVFVMDPEEKVVSGSEYLLAQLTVRKNSNPSMVINVQGKKHSQRNGAWTESNVMFNLVSPESVNSVTIPTNCVIWYDGCNTCMVNNGHIGICTDMVCVANDSVRCLRYSIDGH
jgi:hypothetical protein